MKLTSIGKDPRVLGTSRYLNTGQVHITRHALEKKTEFKGRVANHFIHQLSNYRINDKNRHKKNDDLVDAFCYYVLQAVGNSEGI